ncbi:hypothetical protein TWF718_008771 [Orbilia javanica]|uniref:Uncharacterized protein n=1 Tax=Orbilia javanica TaxID=47235 RepID=A0AAN8RB49_9PEZI
MIESEVRNSADPSSACKTNAYELYSITEPEKSAAYTCATAGVTCGLLHLSITRDLADPEDSEETITATKIAQAVLELSPRINDDIPVVKTRLRYTDGENYNTEQHKLIEKLTWF